MTGMHNEGFETGSDYVAARVSFDIDANGISSLRELSQELERFRTVAEAAGRGSEDFVKYLQQMTQVANQATQAQTQLIAQLQRITDLQQVAITGQGTQISRGVPQGYIDPFSGMGAGTGGQAQRNPTGSGYPATPLGAQSYLGGMAQQDPRQYMNWQAQRGNLRAGDVPAASPNEQDLEHHALRHARREEEQVKRIHGGGNPYSALQNRISGFSSGATQLMNELAPGGGDFMGPLNMVQKGLGSLSGLGRMSGAVKPALAAGQAAAATGEAGVLAGLGGAAGMAAAGIGIPLAAMGMVQAGGQMIQGYRSMGQIQGGGAAEGMGYEMAIRSMALNPFISSDQARKIVMEGLTSGYSGKEFDTVTQFMANNLKDMNIQVADSMKMFKKNVAEGGMSEEGLGGMMQVLKKLAGNGSAMTQADIVSSFADTSSSLINAGVSGQSASAAAAANTQVYAQYEDIKGLGGQMVASASENMTTMGMIRQFGGYSQELQGVDPGGVMEALGGDKGSMAVYNTLSHFARQFLQASGNTKRGRGWAVQQFQMMLQKMFPNIKWTRTSAEKIFTQALQGNPYPAAQAKEREANAAASGIEGRGILELGAKTIGGMIGGGLHSVADIAKGTFSYLWNGKGPEGGFFKGTSDFMAQMDDATTSEHIPIMDAVIEQNGGSRNIQVGDGDNWKKYNANDRAQLEALRSGKLKWRRAGTDDPGTLLTDTTREGKAGGGGAPNSFNDLKGQAVNVGGVLTIKVDQDGRVQAPREVRLSPNTQQAQSGYGGAQLNSPPPGDTPGMNGYDYTYR